MYSPWNPFLVSSFVSQKEQEEKPPKKKDGDRSREALLHQQMFLAARLRSHCSTAKTHQQEAPMTTHPITRKSDSRPP